MKGKLLFLLILSSCVSTLKMSTHEALKNILYQPEIKKVAHLNLNQFSKAPLKSLKAATVNLPQTEAFGLMLKDVHLWFPKLKKFHWKRLSKGDHGEVVKGSQRIGLYKGDRMVETILYNQPNLFFVYKIDLDQTQAFIPIKDHFGVFYVKEISRNQSLIVWGQYYYNSIPFFGFITSWVMEDIVAEGAFKNLVKLYGGQFLL